VERELLTLLKLNDQKALEKLFDLYHKSLCLLAFKITRDKDQAKDIVQEVFIKLWKNRERLEITSSLFAYLKRATVNTALNYLEGATVLRNQPLEKSDLTFHSRDTTGQKLAYDELKEKADDAIQKLPVRTRTIFILIRTEEMSYKEVAEAVDISMKAVEKEMMKALRLLREALKDYLTPSILPLVANIFF
jgi:RNA polymerase sigma-70 factor (ECF subfamily)